MLSLIVVEIIIITFCNSTVSIIFTKISHKSALNLLTIPMIATAGLLSLVQFSAINKNLIKGGDKAIYKINKEDKIKKFLNTINNKNELFSKDFKQKNLIGMATEKEIKVLILI